MHGWFMQVNSESILVKMRPCANLFGSRLSTELIYQTTVTMTYFVISDSGGSVWNNIYIHKYNQSDTPKYMILLSVRTNR